MLDRDQQQPAHACPGATDGGCSHDAFGGAEGQLMESLPEGHLIRVLMEEHVQIRARLDELESLAGRLAEGDGDRDELLRSIGALGSALVGAEPHHQREESILFVELEARGVTGPCGVMNAEHVEIRRLKHIVESEPSVLMGDPEASASRLVNAATALVSGLREHIHKENNVLYPMALGVIREDDVWADMKRRSDEIGYCCTHHA